MAIKVGINGFGRIGRITFRAILKYDKNKDIDVVAINDLADAKTLAYLLKYDSIYGPLENEITAGDDFISIDGKKIPVTMFKDPAQLPWKAMGVEVCIEATGVFRKKEEVQKHIGQKMTSIIVSAKRYLLNIIPKRGDFDFYFPHCYNENRFMKGGWNWLT